MQPELRNALRWTSKPASSRRSDATNMTNHAAQCTRNIGSFRCYRHPRRDHRQAKSRDDRRILKAIPNASCGPSDSARRGYSPAAAVPQAGPEPAWSRPVAGSIPTATTRAKFVSPGSSCLATTRCPSSFKPRPHRLGDARVDDRLVALAVDARRVDRLLDPHPEVEVMHHRVKHPGRDPVTARTRWRRRRRGPRSPRRSVGTAKIGILPGAMQLARSGRGSKFCIELFRNTPVPGTSTSEPNELVRLVQSVAMFPARSAAAIWLVPAIPPADGARRNHLRRHARRVVWPGIGRRDGARHGAVEAGCLPRDWPRTPYWPAPGRELAWRSGSP